MSDKVKLEDDAIASLSDKTLLIPISACELSESEIKDVYNYPFEMVEDEYIENSILEGVKDEVFINLMFSDVGFSWGVFCVESETGIVLNKVGKGGISFGVSLRGGVHDQCGDEPADHVATRADRDPQIVRIFESGDWWTFFEKRFQRMELGQLVEV